MARKSQLIREGKMYANPTSEVEKAYNKAVYNAARRSEYWEKKYGVKANIPQAPRSLDPDAINRIENIRWEHRENVSIEPIIGREQIMAYIEGLIQDITDVEPWISDQVQPVGKSWWKKHVLRAEEYRDAIILSIRETAESAPVSFYTHLMQHDIANKITDIAHRLYGVYRLDANADSKRNEFMNEIYDLLTFDILDDEYLYSTASEYESPFYELDGEYSDGNMDDIFG